MSTPKLTVAALSSLLEQMDARIAAELAAQHKSLNDRCDTLATALRLANEEIARLNSRVEALEARPVSQAPAPRPPRQPAAPVQEVNAPEGFPAYPEDRTQPVTWAGRTRAGGFGLRLGKGDSSVLMDWTPAGWKRRSAGGGTIRPQSPANDYADYAGFC